MGTRFERYDAAHIPAVRKFNQRLDATGADPSYRLGTAPDRPERNEGSPLSTTTYLAVEGTEVRGAIMVQLQPFEIAATPQPVVNIQLPLSEGLIDKRYAFIGMWLIRNVLQLHPLCFAVGMGSLERPLPRLLTAMGWQVRAVPFCFHMHRAGRFLRGLPRLREGLIRRTAADVAAATGFGSLGVKLLSTVRAFRASIPATLEAVSEAEWGPWADEIWAHARTAADMMAVRNRHTLAAIYPDQDRYLIFRLVTDRRTMGWAVLLNTQMRGSDYFGDLRVGTVLDALCIPGWEVAAALAIRSAMTSLGVDLSVTNQAHHAWQAAFHAGGYIDAPSNFLFATSNDLTHALEATTPNAGITRCHITRGDGDGRIHL